jgi:hypothetical protein
LVTIEQLAEKYPRLWHIADPRNVPGILARGLLATSSLLDLLGVDDEVRRVRERERRPDDVVLQTGEHGTVVLRDQRPLSVARLRGGALTAGTIEDFLAFVNGRVFFWPTEERLSRMNGAPAYRDRPQLVFVVETLPLLTAHRLGLLLSRINSGSTVRFAAKRSIATFERPEDYNWSAGKQHVAELTISSGVPDIWTYVERLEVWRNGEHVAVLAPPYDDTLAARLAGFEPPDDPNRATT